MVVVVGERKKKVGYPAKYGNVKILLRNQTVRPTILLPSVQRLLRIDILVLFHYWRSQSPYLAGYPTKEKGAAGAW
ncbi:hypothetical protein HF290_01045 [Acidithiobacillus ferrooxidans]|uniref:hypothetical protein n=1 Tax=Acidithiobacillus ferrooxidans TaxID=920 RepID=UPI001C073B45|nr:hypothetical protein [Acidithiobacillus ferrooxidans]MBU2859057.1 hypothetical protein [Acidithiobacillus ferrooxidans]